MRSFDINWVAPKSDDVSLKRHTKERHTEKKSMERWRQRLE